MKFEYIINVRIYELDFFGYANNAAYIKYLEQARWEVLRQTDTFSFLKEFEYIPAVIETYIRYIRETNIFDALVINTEVKKEQPYFVFYHTIHNLQNRRKCCKARAKVLFLTKEKIPCEIPDYIYKKWGC